MIWKITFVWCVAIWSFCIGKEVSYLIDTIEGQYPYDITIFTQSHNINTFEEQETIIIYQDHRFIDRIETFRDYPLYYLDFDGDGYQELIFKIFDGSRTFDWVIVKIMPKMKKPIVFEGMAELSHIFYINGKPILKTWESYGALYAAKNATVTVYADFNDTHFHLNKALQKKELMMLKIPKKAADIFFRENGFLGTHHPEALMESITYAMQAWYAGESEKAVTLLLRTLQTTDKATMFLFLEDLIDELSQSHYWNDIVHFNGWQSENYEIVGKTFVPHYKNLDKDDIARELFRQMFKK